MTDEELGRKLAEACGFAIEKLRVFLNDVPVYFAPEAENSHPVLFLATDPTTIIRDVFPVLDERFRKWYPRLNGSYDSLLGEQGARWWLVTICADQSGDYGSLYGEGEAPTLHRAMAEACLAALTEVTA